MATIRLPPDFKDFLKLLNSEGVDLKANKKAAGRAKDLADLENLP